MQNLKTILLDEPKHRFGSWAVFEDSIQVNLAFGGKPLMTSSQNPLLRPTNHFLYCLSKTRQRLEELQKSNPSDTLAQEVLYIASILATLHTSVLETYRNTGNENFRMRAKQLWSVHDRMVSQHSYFWWKWEPRAISPSDLRDIIFDMAEIQSQMQSLLLRQYS